MYCGEAVLVKRTAEEIGARLLRCRSWACPICAPERRKQLMALAHHGNPTRFVTLTVNPSRFTGPVDRARRLVAAWRIVRKRAMRHYRMKTLPFLAVVEETERGEPHIHIVARFKWIEQKWLSAQMEELIGAPVVDVRVVRERSKIAAYVAKYVGKEPHQFGTLKRYWCSQDWNLSPLVADDAPVIETRYEVLRGKSLAEWIERMELYDYKVEQERSWCWVHGPPRAVTNGRGWLNDV